MSYIEPILNFSYNFIEFVVIIFVVNSESLLISVYKGISLEFHFWQISFIKFLPSEIEGKQILKIIKKNYEKLFTFVFKINFGAFLGKLKSSIII